MLNLKALVVDDSKIMRKMVMQALTASRIATFEFTEAENGQDALGKFDPATTDICFVDWNMPTMTGIEFVKKARARGDSFNVPMIMVTSEQTMAKIEEAIAQAGADAYICKPFTVEDLQVKLQKVINKLETLKQAGAAAAGGGLLGKLFG